VLGLAQAKIEIKDINEATKYFINFVKHRFEITPDAGVRVRKIVKTNFDRHRIIFFDFGIHFKHKPLVVYLIFQRKYFQEFGKNFQYDDAMATSVRLSILEEIVKHKYDRIAWVYWDGAIYWTDPKYMLKLVKENNWVHKTRKTGEVLAHIPLKFLTKIN
jgi:hypothetical protein